VSCFTNTEAKVTLRLSRQIAFEYKEQSLSSHTSINSWKSISVHRFFNFDTTITLSSDSCNRIFTSSFDWRACYAFNPLAVASHLLPTSVHPNRSNMLAVKNVACFLLNIGWRSLDIVMLRAKSISTGARYLIPYSEIGWRKSNLCRLAQENGFGFL